MTNHIRHFAINADDVERARAFYQRVFGWTFEAWGPPGFYRIHTGQGAGSGMFGALQERRALVEGVRTNAFECTVAVDDVDATAKAVVAQGGRILMDKATIAGVGDLIFFEDPEGNIAGAMQYHDT